MTVRERTFGAASDPETLPLPCPHCCDIESDGRTVAGKCLYCGLVGSFRNAIELADIGPYGRRGAKAKSDRPR